MLITPAVRAGALALCFAGLLLTAPARAEGFYVPFRYARARVTMADSDSTRFVGRLLRIRSDTLAIVQGTQEAGIPLGEVARLDVGSGVRRATARGALIGLVIGGGAGALVGTTDKSEWQGVSIALGAVALGAIGLGVGALAGHSVTHETWVEVPTADVRVGPGGSAWIPAPAGLPLRVTAPAWNKGRWRGTAGGLSGDSLRLVRGSREIRIPTASITKVEATWSKRSFGAWGATIGFAGGLIAGALIHASSQDASTLSLGLGLGLPGALVCSLIGRQVRVPRWEEIPLEPPPLKPVAEATPAPRG